MIDNTFCRPLKFQPGINIKHCLSAHHRSIDTLVQGFRAAFVNSGDSFIAVQKVTEPVYVLIEPRIKRRITLPRQPSQHLQNPVYKETRWMYAFVCMHLCAFIMLCMFCITLISTDCTAV